MHICEPALFPLLSFPTCQDEGWKLSRTNYYQEGWLSTANVRGVVGVTYTTSFCAGSQQAQEVPARTNYNLRGHRSEVSHFLRYSAYAYDHHWSLQ